MQRAPTSWANQIANAVVHVDTNPNGSVNRRALCRRATRQMNSQDSM